MLFLQVTLSLFIISIKANMIDIKIGVFFPPNNPQFQSLMGYNISAGAINLALDRIQQEQLTPNVNYR
jgi:hypothetical protein